MYIDRYFRMNLIINWHFRCYFLSAWQPQTLIARIAHNHLKVMMSLSKNLKQQEALIKVTIETDRKDHPDLDTGKMPSIGT